MIINIVSKEEKKK